ncbi:hypothetical protein GGS21DRAFT_496750 [Xylaria nigripes]|nr:hypothetical protein GGS21DRAFT_496750 [Xylaria nigripes]
MYLSLSHSLSLSSSLSLSLSPLPLLAHRPDGLSIHVWSAADRPTYLTSPTFTYQPFSLSLTKPFSTFPLSFLSHLLISLGLFVV